MLVDARFATHDRDAAQERVQEVYPGSVFRECEAPFTYKQRVVGDSESASIAQFEVSSQSELAVRFDGVVGIAMATGGDYRAASNDELLDTARPFLFRPGIARSWSTHHHVVVVNLDVAALAQHLGADVDAVDPRLRMPSSGPLTDAAGGYWCHVARHATSVFSTAALSSYALIHKATTDLVLASAADAFGMTVEHVASPAGDVALPSALRRAVRFIEDNAAAPIGIVEIAEASRMSVRGVQLAFRRALDTTPTEYLRRARLSHARDHLVTSTPLETTVTEVARAWGFTNLSRFSTAYRQAYDESPRQTLER
jgi:AraC-like DNA-binding protein